MPTRSSSTAASMSCSWPPRPASGPSTSKQPSKPKKHVFCEKPVATDAPGLRSVLETVAEAKRKNLSLVSGFCWRYEFGRRAFYQQVHEGALGTLRAIYATFYTGPV